MIFAGPPQRPLPQPNQIALNLCPPVTGQILSAGAFGARPPAHPAAGTATPGGRQAAKQEAPAWLTDSTAQAAHLTTSGVCDTP